MSYFVIITILISCDDELVIQNQVIAQFEKSTVSVAESEDKLTVKIFFANALNRSGKFTVTFSDEDASRFTTVPSLEQNLVELTAQAGQSFVSFDIEPKDNGSQDGNLSFELTLSTSSDHITIGSTKKSVVTIVDDEGPFSVVQFDSNSMTMYESTGNNPVRIAYSKPAPSNGFIRVRVESSTKESFTTAPGTVNGFVRIPFQTGQTESYFDVIPVNSPGVDGDRKVSLVIAEVSEGILFGDNSELSVTIKDDQSAAVSIGFLNEMGTTPENLAEQWVSLSLSDKVTMDGMVEISFQSERVAYGTHFTTEPSPINGKIVVPVLAGQNQAGFKVIAVNDAVVNGDRSIDFTITAAIGSLVMGGIKSYRLWVEDDELIGLPKGFETLAGAWRYKRVVEYNELGKISQLHWDRNTPGYSEGMMTYHYNAEGRITKIVENAVTEKVYTWEGNRIVKSERLNSGVLRQYTVYGYDNAGNIGETAIFDVQPNGEFVQSLLFVYLYYNNGNIYKQLSYSPNENTGEYVLISTRTYETYNLDKANPFSMVEILPDVNSQPNLPTSYRVEENGHNIFYQFTYEFNEKGMPAKRTATSSAGSEVTNYSYY